MDLLVKPMNFSQCGINLHEVCQYIVLENIGNTQTCTFQHVHLRGIFAFPRSWGREGIATICESEGKKMPSTKQNGKYHFCKATLVCCIKRLSLACCVADKFEQAEIDTTALPSLLNSISALHQVLP